MTWFLIVSVSLDWRDELEDLAVWMCFWRGVSGGVVNRGGVDVFWLLKFHFYFCFLMDIYLCICSSIYLVLFCFCYVIVWFYFYFSPYCLSLLSSNHSILFLCYFSFSYLFPTSFLPLSNLLLLKLMFGLKLILFFTANALLPFLLVSIIALLVLRVFICLGWYWCLVSNDLWRIILWGDEGNEWLKVC